jgi:chromosome segregation ATPase
MSGEQTIREEIPADKQDHVRELENRVAELTEALKEGARISLERELVLQEERMRAERLAFAVTELSRKIDRLERCMPEEIPWWKRIFRPHGRTSSPWRAAFRNFPSP